MEFDQNIFDSSKENLNKVKNSIITIIDNINNVTNSISNNWDSVASDEFVSNMKNSLQKFQSYVDELNECINYMTESSNEMNSTESKNVQIANN